MSATTSFFASCPRGLEELLEAEVKLLNPHKIFVQKGGVEFITTKIKALDFLLTSRLASRLFLKIHYFKIKKMEDIYEKNLKFPWDGLLNLDQTFKIQTLFDQAAKARFNNSMMSSLKLKDSLADYFRTTTGERPSVNTKFPNISLLLRIEKTRDPDEFATTLWLDLCGEALSHRGYRPPKAYAPLRENLAAALVLSTDWKPGLEPLIDPMCGSGTLLVEAAMIALKLPPTFLKIRKRLETSRAQFSFENQLWFLNDKFLTREFDQLIEMHYQNILEGLNTPLQFPLYGYDKDRISLEMSRTSLKTAMIPAELVHLEQSFATDVHLPVEGGPGVILTNPPYGDRLGEEEQLKEEYHQLGEYFKNHAQGYRAYVFTGNAELRKSISLKTSKRIPFFNGDIECRLLKYDLY